MGSSCVAKMTSTYSISAPPNHQGLTVDSTSMPSTIFVSSSGDSGMFTTVAADSNYVESGGTNLKADPDTNLHDVDSLMSLMEATSEDEIGKFFPKIFIFLLELCLS